MQVSKHLRRGKNLASLAAIQGGNALIPLIMFPYLLSKIGPREFAQLAALEAVSFIVLTFSLYSFDVSGLRKISSAARRGKDSLARTHYAILYARLIIFLPCSLLFLAATLLFERSLSLASLAWLLFPLGVILQSSYFYQATSNNFPLALFVTIPRIISLTLAFVFADENTNLVFASCLISASYFVSGAISSIYISIILGFRSLPRLALNSLVLIRQGKSLFVGGLSVLLYRGSNTLLLTALGATPLAISTYAIAEKYVKMIQAITLPLTQVFAIRLVRDIADSKQDGAQLQKTLWKNTRYQIISASAISAAFLLSAMTLAPTINWTIPEQVLHLMFIMMPATVFGIINFMYGTIAFSSLSRESIYARIVIFSGIITILTSTALIKLISSTGAAIAYVFAEILLTTVFIFKLRTMP